MASDLEDTQLILFLTLPCVALSTGLLSVSLSATSTTSLTVSWTLAEGVTATSFTISYSNTDNIQCFNVSLSNTTSETMYTVTGLQEGTEYSITVTAMLSDGGSGEDRLTATTMATG